MKNTLFQFFPFLLLYFLLCAPLVHAEENIPPTFVPSQEITEENKQITISLGETRELSIDAEQAFSSDEDIVSVKQQSPGVLLITGLRVGSTELLFWQNGNLQSTLVTVAPTESIGFIGVTPQFIGKKPYLYHAFANTSSFTKNKIYQSPVYNHSLRGSLPLGQNLHILPITSFLYGENSSFTIPHAAINGNYRNQRFELGNTFYTTNRLRLSGFGGSNFTGGKLTTLSQINKEWKNESTFFAGVDQQNDIRDTRNEQQKFGISTQFTQQKEEDLFGSILAAHGIGFQVPNDTSYHGSGIVEGRLYAGKHYNIAISGGMNEGGFASSTEHNIISNDGLTTLSYDFVKKGLLQLDGSNFSANQHQASLQNQHLLQDQITFVSGGVDWNMSRDDPLEANSQSISSGLGLSRVFSSNKSYGIEHAFVRTQSNETFYDNAARIHFSHMPRLRHFFGYQSSYSRQDGGATSQAAAGEVNYHYEQKKLRYAQSLATQYTVGDKVSLFSRHSLETHLSRFLSYSIGVGYAKNDVLDKIHQVGMGQSLTWYITANHLLLFGSSMNQSFGNGHTLNGVLSANLQSYVGPGIQSDPLLKHLLQNGQRGSVSGVVFLDENYNGSFDKGEVPLERVMLEADGKKNTHTTREGDFQFAKLKTGLHVISVGALPEPYDNAQEWEVPKKVSFYLDETTTRKAFFPVTKKKANLRIRFVQDNNNNMNFDETDDIILIRKIWLKQGDKEARPVRLDQYALIKGLELGTATVALDALELPETFNLNSALEKSIAITDYSEYAIDFFFTAIKVIRGKVQMHNRTNIPKGLVVKLGNSTSKVDASGFFWIEKPEAGTHQLQLLNLPKTLCLKDEIPPIVIDNSPLILETNFILQDECQQAEEKLNE